MKHKPIRIDWDELEVAFTNHDEEIVYYLDLVTGKVLIEGEGEDDDFDDEDDFSANTVVTQAPPPRLDDHTRAYVKPLTTALKLEWMERFVVEKENGLDAQTNARLKDALEGDDAAEALSQFLVDEDEARDAWYLYRSNRLHDHMQVWLDDHQITVIDPAPWS